LFAADSDPVNAPEEAGLGWKWLLVYSPLATAPQQVALPKGFWVPRFPSEIPKWDLQACKEISH